MMNPINVIDPDGMDTVDIKYNTTDNKWEIGTPVIAKGNDVYNVTDANGNKTTRTFSEGTYGNRMNVIMLEDNHEVDKDGNVTVDEAFGVYHLSGTNNTGFVLQPSSNTTSGDHYNVPGEYSTYVGEGQLWFHYIGLKGNGATSGIRIHYGTGRSWSTGCLILSSEYTSHGSGKPKSFNLSKSQAAIKNLINYAGGTADGTRAMGRATRIRDYYTYGTASKGNKFPDFKAPTVTIKK